MASAELSRRVEKVVGYPPLVEMDDRPRREFHEALLDADSFEDLPGEWQAAILEAEQNLPKLRVVADDWWWGATATDGAHSKTKQMFRCERNRCSTGELAGL